MKVGGEAEGIEHGQFTAEAGPPHGGVADTFTEFGRVLANEANRNPGLHLEAVALHVADQAEDIGRVTPFRSGSAAAETRSRRATTCRSDRSCR